MNHSNKGFLPRVLCLAKPIRHYLAACAVLSPVHGAEVDLTPVSAGDGAYTEVTVAGQQAWQNTGATRFLYCPRPDSFTFTAGDTLYVRVTYFDDAAGIVELQYDAQAGAFTKSQLHTRTSRVGSGRFANGYFELPDVLFNKRQSNASDFRIICGTTDGAKVPVQRITLSDVPFDDPDFQAAVARAWQSRFTGPAKDYVDRTSLKGNVITQRQPRLGAPARGQDVFFHLDHRNLRRGCHGSRRQAGPPMTTPPPTVSPTCSSFPSPERTPRCPIRRSAASLVSHSALPNVPAPPASATPSRNPPTSASSMLGLKSPVAPTPTTPPPFPTRCPAPIQSTSSACA